MLLLLDIINILTINGILTTLIPPIEPANHWYKNRYNTIPLKHFKTSHL